METMQVIAKRISTRSYTSQQVTCDEARAILSAGCAAPTANGRYEDLHFTVVQSKDVLDRLTAEIKSMSRSQKEPYYGAPTLVIISSKIPTGEGLDYVNAGCAAENMMLAATDAGIGSVVVWATALVIEANAALKKDLSIPEGFRARLSVCLGYSAEESLEEEPLEITVTTNWI